MNDFIFLRLLTAFYFDILHIFFRTETHGVAFSNIKTENNTINLGDYFINVLYFIERLPSLGVFL